jgi:GAF domain-containing protein/HAMP domain-containing protein
MSKSNNEIKETSSSEEAEIKRGTKTTGGQSGRVRTVTVRRVIIAGATAAISAALINLFIYLKDGHWQMLALAGFEVFAALFLIPAAVGLRRGKTKSAGHWVLTGAALAFGFAELLHAGLTPLFLIGGILIIIIVGNILLPRRWGAWAIIAIVYLVFIVLVNQLEPLPRYDLGSLPGMRVFVILLMIALTGVAVWQMIQAYRHIETIRTRLIVSFILVVSVPMGAIIAASVIGGIQSGQDRAFSQLESIATLKESEVNAWLETLQIDITTLLGGQSEMEYATIMLLQEENTDSERYQDAQNHLRERFMEPVERAGRFAQVFLLNANGRAICSTDPEQEGNNYRGFSFFQVGLERDQAYLTWEWGTWWLDTVHPVRDEDGNVFGVLVGRTDMQTLNQVMSERAGLGDTGETYIVSAERAVLTDLNTEERIPYMPEESMYGTIVTARHDGQALYENYEGEPVIGVYRWVGDFNAALIAEQTQFEAFATTRSAILIMAIVAVGAIGIAVAAALLITRDIATPLAELAVTATLIAEGDLTHVARVVREDEIGALARAFNSMTARLRDFISGLERRVAERTHELEQRTGQLEAAAQVARETLAIRDLGELLSHTASLISERFGFYHVGIFLLDEAREYAVLMAANSEGGRRMMARGHRLRVSPIGIVGYVMHTGEPRISVGVSEDEIHLKNPDLPLTQSEMALPLKVGREIIGALDVQTTEVTAFTEDDIKVLQILADQLAVAIQNSRLIAQTQQALTEVQSLHRQYLQTEWSKVAAERGALVHEYTRVGVPRLVEIGGAESGQAAKEHDTAATGRNGNGHSRADVKATMAVPITLRDQVIGVIDIQETEMERQWTDDELNLVQTISDQMAQALENVRLFEDARVRAEELTGLNDLSQALASALTVDEVLQEAYEGSSRLIDTTNFYVGLYDQDKQEISFPIDITDGQPEETTTVISVGKGMIGHVMATRQALFLEDSSPQLLTEMGIEVIGKPARSYVGAPLLIGNQVLGAIAVQSYDTPHAFGEHDRELLVAIANQTAIALQKAYLFEDARLRAEELGVLNELGQALASALTIDDVLQKAYHGTSQLMDTTNYYIALYDANTNTVSLPVNISESHEDQQITSFPADRGLTGYIIRTRKSLLVREDITQVMSELGIKRVGGAATSWLGVPIMVGDRVLGVMALQSYTRTHAFSEHDEELLTGVANQTAIALQNAYLFEEIQITLEETETLYNASRRIAAASDLDEIVAAVAEEVQVAAINRATLWVAEQDAAGNVTHFVSAANWYREEGTSPLPLPVGTRLSLAEFPTTRLNIGGEAMFIEDISENEQVDAMIRDMFAEQEVRAIALLPLQIGARPIGTLMLTGEEPHQFGDRATRPYRSLAGQMAVAVESQRLIEETRRRAQELEAINETGRVITSVLDLDVLIRQIVDATKERFGHFFVGISLVYGDQLIFRDGSTIGETGERLGYEGYVFDLDTPGIITDAARTRKPVLIPDVLETSRYIALPELAKARSELAVPIEAKGEVIGVLDVQSDLPYAYDTIDILLLQSLASQAGVALQNAQLFNEAEQTAWREQSAREIIARVQAAPDVESILQTAVRELGQALNIPRATVQLSTRHENENPQAGDGSGSQRGNGGENK